MSYELGRALIIGAGPAAFQTANLIASYCKAMGLASRQSARWDERYALLELSGVATCEAAKPSLEPLSGQVKFDHVFPSLPAVTEHWDTLILATPSHAYKEALLALPERTLKCVTQVVLISSMFGGHQLVKGFFHSNGLSPNITVFSNYYAATKFSACSQTDGVKVITKAAKKRVYVHETQKGGEATATFSRVLGNVGVDVVELDNAFSVEGRNITTYVHPAFFITPFSLNHILSKNGDKKFMYKLFPEGPVTQTAIKTLVDLWRDISTLISHYSGTPINLLQFLNDDNYPVHEETISREQINGFNELSPIEQEYLIYIRYTAILIDPFSTPDQQGRYFDFSAVPYAKGEVRNGELVLPRVPLEDLQTLYWIQALATYSELRLPTVERILGVFESWLKDNKLPSAVVDQLECQAQENLRWVIKGNTSL
ncbi:opine metallophore biosynthesis dehydrogenase [Vibrio sp. S9_S30]|uniref:opine metallophore biosynthesis dehydrogenase n=1 Tax=Vibrio sp. S9_S30 TaxID=2720226 RepID=UPI001681977B|nr:opine metallophore biosynthesis dehydrogenase [Vibrio sp. S9_S30]MBD1557062.1 opine metallophore biosynthesis dehydrogenase [Vibrio sp. S9_S30]